MSSPLPPEVRFTARALRAGLPAASVAAILGAERAVVEKHVRSAVRAAGGQSPPPGADDATLLAALGADTPDGPAPSTACPDDDVVGTLAHGLLDGPLLLATAEHAADCAGCMERVLRARDADPPSPRRPGGGGHPVLLVLVLALAALAGLFLLFG